MPGKLNEPIRITDAVGRRWSVDPDWAGRLFDHGSFLPPRLVAHETTIRRTGSREVSLVRLAEAPECGVVVKTYVPRGPLDGLLRGSVFETPAEIEWRIGRAAIAAGLDVAEPVAAGRERVRPAKVRSWLAVREIPTASDLSRVAAAPSTGVRFRRRLVEALADVFRTWHDAGFQHEDPNLDNFLVSGGEASPRIVPIDLRRVRMGAPLDRAARFRNLGRLFPASVGTASFAERIRFLRRYLGSGASKEDLRGVAAAIAGAGVDLFARRALHRMQGSVRGDRRFARREAGGLDWCIRRDLPDAAIEKLLSDPEAAFADSTDTIKSGRSARVARASPFVVKRFNQKRAWNQLFDRVRLDRARRNLARCALLEFLRIPTPRVLAAAPRTRRGLVRCSYCITEEIPGARNLVDALESGLASAALEMLGGHVARLHAFGWSHRDLKGTNVLIDAAGMPWLVDLDGIRRRPATIERRGADLARLFRDFAARGAQAAEWVDAVLRGYRREAPAPVVAALRVRFAAPEAA